MPRWNASLALPVPALAALASLVSLAAPARAETTITATGAVSVDGASVAPAAPAAPPAAEPAPAAAVAVGAPLPATLTADEVEHAATFKKRPYLGLWGGVGVANVVHPQLGTPHVYGPLLAMQVGYTPTPQWALALEFSSLSTPVVRSTAAVRFGAGSSFLHSEAECTSCTAPPPGGVITNTTLLLNQVGPRVDFTPFGPNGFYLGATGGVAIVSLLDTRVGGGGGARAGFRLRVADVLAVGLEAGVQGQAFAAGSTLMGYGALAAQLGLETTRTGKRRALPMSAPRNVVVPR